MLLKAVSPYRRDSRAWHIPVGLYQSMNNSTNYRSLQTFLSHLRKPFETECEWPYYEREPWIWLNL